MRSVMYFCGAGMNGTVLHYRANNAPLLAGDVVVLDSGAQYAGYAAYGNGLQ